MDVTLDINDNDTKTGYDSVKSLLKKLNYVDENNKSIKSLNIKLNFSNTSDLSQIILWRYSLYFKNYPFLKHFSISKKSFFVLNKVGFFDRLVNPKSDLLSFEKVTPLHYETFKPYVEEGNLTEERLEAIFENTFDKHIDKENPVHSETRIHIKEVLSNIFDHSQSIADAGMICKVTDTNISFSVGDMGQGFKNSFISNPSLMSEYSRYNDQEIIEKATEFKVSCNPSENPNPKYTHKNAGGGLYFLKKFTELHKDNKLIIVSNKGYFYLDGQGRLKKRSLDTVNWPGALVFFQVGKNQLKSSEYIEICESVYGNKEIDSSYITIV